MLKREMNWKGIAPDDPLQFRVRAHRSILAGLAFVFILCSAVPADAQDVDLTAGLQTGVQKVNPSKGWILAGEVGTRWDFGLELLVGAEAAYWWGETFGACFPEELCPPRENLGAFERVRFWSIYLEPRYHLPTPDWLVIRPFLGARAGRVHWVKLHASKYINARHIPDGYEYGLTAGVELPISPVAVEVSGIWGRVTESPPPGSLYVKRFPRLGLRSGLRVRF